MKRVNVFLYILFFFILVFSVFLGCSKSVVSGFNDYDKFTSYKEVPGITEREITAIEKLREQDANRTFIYGMPLNTEAYEDENGETKGFSVLFCDWLTELFGFNFKPVLFDWVDLLDGMEKKEISFSGELTATEARREIYNMTSAIATRPVKCFRLNDSRPLAEIAKERLVRSGFIEGAATINAVTGELTPGTFEIVTINDFNDAYDALKSGKFDAFYYSGVAEVSFIEYDDIIVLDFYPLVFMSVSLSTRDPDLEPIISVVEKILENGGLHHLTKMYNQAHQEYLKYKLYMRLTEEERKYIIDNPVALMAVDPGNYPGCFYDKRENKWGGISLDILDEVSYLTGLTFERINDETINWTEIQQLLRSGEIHLVPELNQTPERIGQYIWANTAQMTDYYCLISNVDFPYIKVNEIIYVKVGLAKNTSYAAVFKKWFPDHINTIEYDTVEEAFEALQRGEIDMVMANQKRLLYLTHYLELPNYKTNVVFDYAIDIKFGFNKDEVILRSIIDKAMDMIETKRISDSWMSRTYDYRIKVEQAQRPLLIVLYILLLSVLALVIIFFVRSRFEEKRLELLVEKRTYELKEMEQTASAASRSKSTFLANMSHEIRTPMNAILGITEILIQYEKLPAEIEEGLGKIYSSCDLLLGIINDILDFSKIEAGKLDIMPAQYKVASMINDSVHLNMMRIDSKPIEFELQVDENIPAVLVGDELRIKQIFNNLLSNAFKYTESGKVVLSLNVIPQFRNKDDITLVISVQDTGHGMTSEQLSKLFVEYSRFNTDKNISIEGTGLGLAITRRLIGLMNGSMNVESEAGKGSLFTIKLPQKKIDDEVLGKELVENLRQFRVNYMAHRKKGQITRDLMPYGSVLIVDDVETNIYVAVGLMKLYKLQIDTAMSGQEAVSKIKEGRKYDIIFMDHMMPEMDGIEATKLIRDMGYTAPIVALTANAVAGQADIFLQNGFDHFISKPIDIRQLNTVLNKLVRDKQPPEVINNARRQITESILQIDSLLYESFIRDARKALMWLEEQTNEGFTKEEIIRKFTVLVHGMKSSLWNIGEDILAEMAQMLEKSGQEYNSEIIIKSTPGFINSLRTLLEKLESMQNEETEDYEHTDEDVHYLCNKLQVMNEMCLEYNRKGILDILADIKRCSKETKKSLDIIMTHVLHSEFDEANAVVKKLAEDLVSGK